MYKLRLENTNVNKIKNIATNKMENSNTKKIRNNIININRKNKNINKNKILNYKFRFLNNIASLCLIEL